VTATIFLVRHGQVDSNAQGLFSDWSDEDLDEVGYEQVRKLGVRLGKMPIDTVYASPLRRAHTTATILAGPRNLEVNTMDDLKELHVGDWQMRHWREVEQGWPEIWQQMWTDPSEVTYPNGERFQQTTERAVRAFEQIVAQNRDKQVLIVTHNIIAKLLVAHALEMPNRIVPKFAISNASLSVIRVDGNLCYLAALNDTSHIRG